MKLPWWALLAGLLAAACSAGSADSSDAGRATSENGQRTTCPESTQCTTVTYPPEGGCVVTNRPDGSVCPPYTGCAAGVCKSGVCVAVNQAGKPCGNQSPAEIAQCGRATCDGKGDCIAAGLAQPCTTTDVCRPVGECDSAGHCAAPLKVGPIDSEVSDCQRVECGLDGKTVVKAAVGAPCPLSPKQCTKAMGTCQEGGVCAPVITPGAPCKPAAGSCGNDTGTCQADGTCVANAFVVGVPCTPVAVWDANGTGTGKATSELDCIDSGTCGKDGKCVPKAAVGKKCWLPDHVCGAKGACDGKAECWPASAVGSPCTPDGAGPCAVGGVCGPDAACLPVYQAGKACPGSDACHPTGQCQADGNCATVLALGATCATADPCRPVGQCAADGSCQASVAVGKPCEGKAPNCGVMRCQPDGTCQAEPMVGAACPVVNPCLKGVCQADYGCKAVPNPGASCGPPLPTQGCETGICGDDGTCKVTVNAGKACGSGLVCSPAGFCAKPCELGQPCMSWCGMGTCTANGVCATPEVAGKPIFFSADPKELPVCLKSCVCNAVGGIDCVRVPDGAPCPASAGPCLKNGVCMAGRCVPAEVLGPLCPPQPCDALKCCTGNPDTQPSNCKTSEAGLCKGEYGSSASDEGSECKAGCCQTAACVGYQTGLPICKIKTNYDCLFKDNNCLQLATPPLCHKCTADYSVCPCQPKCLPVTGPSCGDGLACVDGKCLIAAP